MTTQPTDRGMDVLEALILVRQERCRVTFLEDEVVVEEAVALDPDAQDHDVVIDRRNCDWSVVASGPRFVAAVREAAIKRGWTMKK
jgi:hypothetical protein